MEQTKELTTFGKTADLVLTYAKKTMDEEIANAYWTQLSVMAKQNDRIAQCTSDSIVTGMLACIRVGLMPNTPEQLAFLIPYRNSKTNQYELSLQLGWRGLKELAYRSGMVRVLNGELVFEGDEFKVQLGSDRKLIHNPDYSIDRTDFSKVTHVYITAKISTGEDYFHVMTREEVDKIEADATKRNFNKKPEPWSKWWDQQALKTAFKRASKQLPSNSNDNRLTLAIQYDSLATAHRLTHKDGELIEGQEVDTAAETKANQDRIARAEAERKRLMEVGGTPKAEEPIDEPTDDTPQTIELTPEEEAQIGAN